MKWHCRVRVSPCRSAHSSATTFSLLSVSPSFAPPPPSVPQSPASAAPGPLVEFRSVRFCRRLGRARHWRHRRESTGSALEEPALPWGEDTQTMRHRHFRGQCSGDAFWAPDAESRRTRSSVEEALAEGTYHKNCGCPGTQRPRCIRYIFSASQGVYLNPLTLFSGKVTSQGRRTTIRGLGPEEASSCEDPSRSTAPVLAAR